MIATMRNPDKEAELATLPGVVLFPLDITDGQQIESAATRAVGLGGVDVVFNNAGYRMAGPLEGVTDEQMLRMVNTNPMGPIRTKRHSSRISEQRGQGRSSIRPPSVD